MTNTLSVHICHYKPNKDRFEYLSRALSNCGLKVTWNTEYDAEEIQNAISGVYQLNTKLWWEYVDVIRSVLLANAVTCNLSTIAMSTQNYGNQHKLYLDSVTPTPAWMHPRELSLREISLFLKHIKAWQAIANGDHEYGLVLEDDVIMGAAGFGDLELIIKHLPPDCQFLDLAGGANLVPFSDHERINGCFYKIAPPMTRTTCAYLMRKDLTIELVRNLEALVLPVDWQLTYYFAKLNTIVYWIEPKLYIHGSAEGQYISNMR